MGTPHRHGHDLVNMGELMATLGVTRNRAYAISRDRTFPGPVWQSARFRLWERADVEAWMDRYRPGWRQRRAPS